jgi:hypothetical protein
MYKKKAVKSGGIDLTLDLELTDLRVDWADISANVNVCNHHSTGNNTSK